MLALWRAPGGVDKDGRPGVGWFKLSPEADAALRAFEEWLEPQLAEGGELGWIADWASKLAGAVVRIAGILHAAAGIGTGATMTAAVPRQTVAAAVRLAGTYLIPHAKAAFGLIGADRQSREAARALAKLADFHGFVVSENGGRLLSRRDLHVKILGTRHTADEIDSVVTLLARHGYLRPAPADKKGTPGRPRGPVYEVNPHLLAESDPPQQRQQNNESRAAPGVESNFRCFDVIENAPSPPDDEEGEVTL
jgi:hypothetical protein